MTKRLLSKAQIDRIVELREVGKTMEQIARLVGCSASTCNWHCTTHGVVSPKHGGKFLGRRLGPDVVKRGDHVIRRFSEEEDKLIEVMRIAGHGPSAIGKAVGRRCNSIIGRLATLARIAEHAA